MLIVYKVFTSFIMIIVFMDYNADPAYVQMYECTTAPCGATSYINCYK